MRYIYIVLITIIITLVVLFTLQNLQSVTATFYTASITLPLSALILLIYVLGMVTGGFVVSLLRAIIQGATKEREYPDKPVR